MGIDPYKGVRDFYPEDEAIQNYIFAAMRRAVEAYGYEEMNASVLEPTDLYAAKTSEEIVSQQTYTFTDRGGRSVTLRPEMTPTVARMVAARKRELGFPLRWYSIQNFFRYERPQRGRLREFWQLNADLFGAPGIEADAEVISLAHAIMLELGAKEGDFEIIFSNRRFLEEVYEKNDVPKDKRNIITRLIDRYGGSEFSQLIEEIALILEDKDKANRVYGDILDGEQTGFEPNIRLYKVLQDRGVRNIRIDHFIARGFDYYTGVIFEIFDRSGKNPRAMFGGGRYDNLVGQYGKDGVPAVGFAMGDVIARDFLETHGLLPQLPPSAHLYLAPVTESDAEGAAALARTLRAAGVNVALGIGHEKMSDHIKAALKNGIPYFAAYGEKEKESGTVTLKTLASGTEEALPIEKVAGYITRL